MSDQIRQLLLSMRLAASATRSSRPFTLAYAGSAPNSGRTRNTPSRFASRAMGRQNETLPDAPGRKRVSKARPVAVVSLP